MVDISELKIQIANLLMAELGEDDNFNPDILLSKVELAIRDVMAKREYGNSHYTDAKTLTHIVTEIDTLKDGQLKIQLVVKLQQNGYEKSSSITWIEGIGSINGIIGNNATLRVGSGVHVLLCAYHNDDCIYTTDDSYYTPYGCVYNDPIFTATEEVKSTKPSAQKVIYNGQLLILRDGNTYNVMGMEVK